MWELSDKAKQTANKNGIKHSVVKDRLRRGWMESVAVSTPVKNSSPYYYTIAKGTRFIKRCESTSQIAQFLSEVTKITVTKNMVIGMFDRHGAKVAMLGYVLTRHKKGL